MKSIVRVTSTKYKKYTKVVFTVLINLLLSLVRDRGHTYEKLVSEEPQYTALALKSQQTVAPSVMLLISSPSKIPFRGQESRFPQSHKDPRTTAESKGYSSLRGTIGLTALSTSASVVSHRQGRSMALFRLPTGTTTTKGIFTG
ncbi:hypothetical protein J6590_032354 [Homalodisca vitripennis]|nr:hypothetical protein J6590_032354 [Homalodisca vitripennis]